MSIKKMLAAGALALAVMLSGCDKPIEAVDAAAIEDAVKRVIDENEKSVSQYRDGKTQAFQYLIGQCMRALGGKAPASAVTEALKRLI